MHYVYLLISARSSRRRYVGLTANLKQRLTEHNSGKSPHTSKRVIELRTTVPEITNSGPVCPSRMVGY
jgi:predicted GIY-YIG superfamily endonuclease